MLDLLHPLFSAIVTTFFFLSPQVKANEELRNAMIFDNWEAALEIIENATDLNPLIPMVETPGPYQGVPALSFALIKNQLKVARKLLEKCQNCTITASPVQNPVISTPLWHASGVDEPSQQLLAEILEKFPNTDVNARPANPSFPTVLHNLARKNFPKLIKQINDQKGPDDKNRPEPDFNATYEKGEYAGTTPLWWIAKHESFFAFDQIIRTEREYQYNFDAAPVGGGETVFTLVTKNNWWELASLILTKAQVNVLGNVDINNHSSVRRAIVAGKWEVLAELTKQLPASVSYKSLLIPSIFLLLTKSGRYDECADLLGKVSGQVDYREFDVAAQSIVERAQAVTTEGMANFLLSWYFNPEQPHDNSWNKIMAQRWPQFPYTKLREQVREMNSIFRAAAAIASDNRKPSNGVQKTNEALDYIKRERPNYYEALGPKFISKMLEAFEKNHEHTQRRLVVDEIVKDIAPKIDSDNQNKTKSFRVEYCPGCKVATQIGDSLMPMLARKKIPAAFLQEQRELLTQGLLALPFDGVDEASILNVVERIFLGGTSSHQS